MCCRCLATSASNFNQWNVHGCDFKDLADFVYDVHQMSSLNAWLPSKSIIAFYSRGCDISDHVLDALILKNKKCLLNIFS